MFSDVFNVFSLRPRSTVHRIYGFLFPPREPGQNPGQKSGQKPGQNLVKFQKYVQTTSKNTPKYLYPIDPINRQNNWGERGLGVLFGPFKVR